MGMYSSLSPRMDRDLNSLALEAILGDGDTRACLSSMHVRPLHTILDPFDSLQGS